MIAVVIPCYRVKAHILGVIARLGPEVGAIYVVDDACPEHSGSYVEAECHDPRVTVLYHQHNGGVGAAVVTGYRRALADGADIVVKIDGDGQMAPELVPRFVRPIEAGLADYVKGNRFYDLRALSPMPWLRKLGNAVLSFLTKLSSGYWGVVDPTNGYTAIHARVLELLPLERLSRGYFFESDLLFRLNVVDAVVCDVPMRAVYGGEQSSLSILKVIPRFLAGHGLNTLKRIVYCHFLRGFSVASLELVFALPLLLFSLVFGVLKWTQSVHSGVAASAGTVMLAALPGLVGLQLLLSFLSFDMARRPQLPRHVLFNRLPPALSSESLEPVAPPEAVRGAAQASADETAVAKAGR